MNKTRSWLRRQTTALSMHLTILGSLGVLAAAMAKSDMGAGGGAVVTEPAAAPPPADTGSAPPPAGDQAPPPAAPPAGDRPLESLSQAELVELNRKLKDENVSYKDRFRPYEQTVGNLDPSDSQAFLGFISDLASGDPQKMGAAAKWMRGHLDRLSPAEQAAAEQAAAAGTPTGEEDFDPFDKQAIENMIAERTKAGIDEAMTAREKAAEEQRNRDQVLGEMKDYAGELAKTYDIPDLAKPGSTLSDQLFITAQKPEFSHIGDWRERLKAAAEAIHVSMGEYAVAYMQRKSAEAGETTAPPAGEAPSGSKKPKTMAQARESAEARLEAFERGVGNT